MRLKPSKCNFAVKEVKYLGPVLSKDGISVDRSIVEAVKSFPEPKNTTDIRAFLGTNKLVETARPNHVCHEYNNSYRVHSVQPLLYDV